LRHQLPGTDYGFDTPAGDFGTVAGAGRSDSGAAHTGKHLVVSVHLGDVRCPGAGLGATVAAAGCSLRNVFVCSSEVKQDAVLVPVSAKRSNSIRTTSIYRYQTTISHFCHYNWGRKSIKHCIYIIFILLHW